MVVSKCANSNLQVFESILVQCKVILMDSASSTLSSNADVKGQNWILLDTVANIQGCARSFMKALESKSKREK